MWLTTSGAERSDTRAIEDSLTCCVPCAPPLATGLAGVAVLAPAARPELLEVVDPGGLLAGT